MCEMPEEWWRRSWRNGRQELYLRWRKWSLRTCLGGLMVLESGWWFQTFFIFHYIYGIVLPIDELIFFKMVIALPPTGNLWDVNHPGHSEWPANPMASGHIISRQTFSSTSPWTIQRKLFLSCSIRVLATVQMGMGGNRVSKKRTIHIYIYVYIYIYICGLTALKFCSIPAKQFKRRSIHQTWRRVWLSHRWNACSEQCQARINSLWGRLHQKIVIIVY